MTNEKEAPEWWKKTLSDIETILYECSESTPSDYRVIDDEEFMKRLKIYAKQRTAPKN